MLVSLLQWPSNGANCKSKGKTTMYDTPVVLLCGRAGVGKSTFAIRLTDAIDPIPLVPLSFALPVKAATAMMNPAVLLRTHREQPMRFRLLQMLADDVSRQKSDEFLNTGVSYRRVLQTLGTDWGRHLIHPDIWLQSWLSLAEWMFIERQIGGCIVIDDLRFANELEFIRERFSRVLAVRLSGRTQSIEEFNHASEHEIDSLAVDYTIDWMDETADDEEYDGKARSFDAASRHARVRNAIEITQIAESLRLLAV